MEVINYTTAELVEVMGDAGIHCSLDRFKRVAIELQQRAIRSTLCAKGPVVEIRVVDESEGGNLD
jgi:hypothetical protein